MPNNDIAMSEMQEALQRLSLGKTLRVDSFNALIAGENSCTAMVVRDDELGCASIIAQQMHDQDAEDFVTICNALAALRSTSWQEPVAWMYENESGEQTFEFNPNGDSARWLLENGYTETPLYTRPSPPPATQEGGEAVTQEDREAAATHMPGNTVAELNRILQVKRGDRDEEPLVQAFRAHRLTAEARMTEKIAELVISAREVAFGLPLDLCRHVPEALELMNALDRATEPFAESVPWDDEPSAALRAGDHKGEPGQ